MTIVICAFSDSSKHSLKYRSFEALDEAVAFYRSLLEAAQFEAEAKKPRTISTRVLRT